MKKIFLSCLFVASMAVSCSDDDANNGNGNPNSPLKSITQKMYEEGDLRRIYIDEYDNGKMVKHRWLTPQNVEMGYTHIVYTNGLWSSSIDYVNNQETGASTYSYDNQGRITTFITDIENTHRTITYTYDGNVVTSTTTIGEWSEVMKFFINSNGNVYRQEYNSGYFYELAFEGNLAVAGTSPTGTVTYEYDNTHNFNLLGLNNGAGNFKANVALRSQTVEAGLEGLGGKYLIKKTSPGDYEVEYIYTFNDAGLPLTRKDYRNDVLFNEMEYNYE